MALTRAELRRRIERVRKLIQQKATPFADVSEKAREERRKKALEDPFFFCKTYLPHYFPLEFADFHKELWEFSEISDEPVFIAAPREHAKSTIVSLAVPLRDICLELRHFILMISDTEDLASSFLQFIKLELEENERIKQDFGDLRGYPWKDDDFTTRNGVRVKARGAMGRVRGLRNRQFRPDRVIFDDFENDKTVKNPKLVKERISWIKEAVIPALADGYFFVYVGTILSKRSVLNYFLRSEEPRYIGKVYRAFKSDGEPLWPARWSKEKLLRRKKAIGVIAFNKEYMNDPRDEEGLFREEWIRWVDEAPSELRIYGFLDPSMKKGETNDFKAFVTIGVDKAGVMYVLDVWLKKASVNEMAKAVYDAYERHRHLVIGAEENALGEFLYVPFDELAKEKGYVLPLKGVQHFSDKVARISRLSPLVERGKILFVRTQGVRQLVEQLIYFPEAEHDDGPDALEGAVSIAERYRVTPRYERVEGTRAKFGKGAW